MAAPSTGWRLALAALATCAAGAFPACGDDAEPASPAAGAVEGQEPVYATPVEPPDAGAAPGDAGAPGDAATPDAATSPNIAPDGLVAGELAGQPTQAVTLAANAKVTLRVELGPTEHLGAKLAFTPAGAPVDLEILRFANGAAHSLGTTNAGGGIRTLAAFDPSGPRTFWVRVTAKAQALSGTLALERTAFEDGLRCTADCAKLMQLPLPIDPAVDGYRTDSGTIFRYQFGRRDLVMMLRDTARGLAKAGRAAFVPYDLSQWDGQTPGTDVGAPRHASHQRGKDVDVSLFGTDAKAVWRSFCTTQAVSGGRECVDGTARDLDGKVTSTELAGFYASDRVTMMFLDRELIELVAPASKVANAEGLVATRLLPLYTDGRHLQHWPNHDNHVHVRVSEDPYGVASRSVLGPEPFEAP